MSNKKFFTADLHFHHTNIIKYCDRPYETVHEMNEDLIKKWNERISKHDEVYILGDISLGKEEETYNTLKRLNGKKYLVYGNHDNRIVRKSEKIKSLFEWCKDIAEIYIKVSGEKKRLILCHYALRTWNKSYKYSWQLYGHSHGLLEEDPDLLSFDVGVDCNNYTPLSEEEVIKKLLPKEKLIKNTK